MYEIIPIKVIYHSGDFQEKRQISIRYNRSDFPTPKSLKKYLKNVIINNYSHHSTARKIEVSVVGNGDCIENALKFKAKKVEIVEQIVVDVYW